MKYRVILRALFNVTLKAIHFSLVLKRVSFENETGKVLFLSLFGCEKTFLFIRHAAMHYLDSHDAFITKDWVLLRRLIYTSQMSSLLKTVTEMLYAQHLYAVCKTGIAIM